MYVGMYVCMYVKPMIKMSGGVVVTVVDLLLIFLRCRWHSFSFETAAMRVWANQTRGTNNSRFVQLVPLIKVFKFNSGLRK